MDEIGQTQVAVNEQRAELYRQLALLIETGPVKLLNQRWSVVRLMQSGRETTINVGEFDPTAPLPEIPLGPVVIGASYSPLSGDAEGHVGIGAANVASAGLMGSGSLEDSNWDLSLYASAGPLEALFGNYHAEFTVNNPAGSTVSVESNLVGPSVQLDLLVSYQVNSEPDYQEMAQQILGTEANAALLVPGTNDLFLTLALYEWNWQR